YSDTLRLTLAEAETRFLTENLDLLIAKTDIDISKAYVLQSKLYSNPEINLNRQLYNFNSKKFLENGSQAQFEVQATQLISTAGKYFKEIQLSKQKVKLSEYEFYNTLRSLKFDLRQNYFELAQAQQKRIVLSTGMEELNKLIDEVKIQVAKGNVAQKELVRLQSLLVEFSANEAELQIQIISNVAALKQLLNYSGNEFIVANSESVDWLPQRISALTFDSIQTTAFANRYDMQASTLMVDISKNQVQLERMRGVPDLELGVDYDRLGNSVQNYLGLTVNVPLPLWNHNEGSIKAAKANFSQAQLQLKNNELIVRNDLQEAYYQLLIKSNLYNTANKHYSKSSDDLYNNIYDSYKARTIGLIEFLEYFESYRDTKFRLIDIATDLQIQTQQLNFETGKDVIN
ncbi:MAG TPA: TolC family protein, partial [Chitinophagales bacterium]